MAYEHRPLLFRLLAVIAFLPFLVGRSLADVASYAGHVAVDIIAQLKPDAATALHVGHITRLQADSLPATSSLRAFMARVLSHARFMGGGFNGHRSARLLPA